MQELMGLIKTNKAEAAKINARGKGKKGSERDDGGLQTLRAALQTQAPAKKTGK